jgi:deazaflavin-dependent oxidoreductase (nitroreductase family)
LTEDAVPLPAALARFNRRVTNPLTRSIAGRVPPLAIVVHRGRRSGREYRTPVLAFPSSDRVLIALTYGAGTDWVRNVLAAGGCDLEWRGRSLPLGRPEVVDLASGFTAIPVVLRPIVRLIGVKECLRLERA